MIIAQLSIAPLGTGASVSKYVKIALDTLKKEQVTFQTNPMATVIECKDLPTLFAVVTKAHQAVAAAGAPRIITELKIDDRRDKDATMTSKLKALQKT
ncbi:MAG TPA: MTH1187 family thiamine-binding protein [Candidatus Thermoplasmatota archaeon]|nr:MTH1187 family thiamine-binding protein [Candidatus Thermoplasmatota archaeon]